jgi:hypothetical protein
MHTRGDETVLLEQRAVFLSSDCGDTRQLDFAITNVRQRLQRSRQVFGHRVSDGVELNADGTIQRSKPRLCRVCVKAGEPRECE